jgi:hypothetical protein
LEDSFVLVLVLVRLGGFGLESLSFSLSGIRIFETFVVGVSMVVGRFEPDLVRLGVGDVMFWILNNTNGSSSSDEHIIVSLGVVGTFEWSERLCSRKLNKKASAAGRISSLSGIEDDSIEEYSSSSSANDGFHGDSLDDSLSIPGSQAAAAAIPGGVFGSAPFCCRKCMLFGFSFTINDLLSSKSHRRVLGCISISSFFFFFFTTLSS